MASSSMEALVDARRSIGDALAVARGRIKRARRRAAADSRIWVLPPHIQRASLAMYMLADYDAEPAVNYFGGACS